MSKQQSTAGSETDNKITLPIQLHICLDGVQLSKQQSSAGSETNIKNTLAIQLHICLDCIQLSKQQSTAGSETDNKNYTSNTATYLFRWYAVEQAAIKCWQ